MKFYLFSFTTCCVCYIGEWMIEAAGGWLGEPGLVQGLMLSRADMEHLCSSWCRPFSKWAKSAGEPGDILPSLLWLEGDISAAIEGGGGGRDPPAASCMLFKDKKYFVAACLSCSRSSAVCLLKMKIKKIKTVLSWCTHLCSPIGNTGLFLGLKSDIVVAQFPRYDSQKGLDKPV